MAKRSGFLVRQKARELARDALVRQIVGQFDTDTAIIALCDVFGFGYRRLLRFLEAWQKKREEYVGAMFPKEDNEADVKQEHLDSELREIMRRAKKEHDFMPFKERYPMLMEVSYERKK